MECSGGHGGGDRGLTTAGAPASGGYTIFVRTPAEVAREGMRNTDTARQLEMDIDNKWHLIVFTLGPGEFESGGFGGYGGSVGTGMRDLGGSVACLGLSKARVLGGLGRNLVIRGVACSVAMATATTPSDQISALEVKRTFSPT